MFLWVTNKNKKDSPDVWLFPVFGAWKERNLAFCPDFCCFVVWLRWSQSSLLPWLWCFEPQCPTAGAFCFVWFPACGETKHVEEKHLPLCTLKKMVKKWLQIVLKVLWLGVFFFLHWMTPDSSGCSLWNMSNQVSLQHQDDVRVFLHAHFPWYNFNLKSQINVLIPKQIRRTQHHGWRDVRWIVSSLPWFPRDAATKQKNMVRFRAQRKLGSQCGAKTGSCTVFPGHCPPWTAEQVEKMWTRERTALMKKMRKGKSERPEPGGRKELRGPGWTCYLVKDASFRRLHLTLHTLRDPCGAFGWGQQPGR